MVTEETVVAPSVRADIGDDLVDVWFVRVICKDVESVFIRWRSG